MDVVVDCGGWQGEKAIKITCSDGSGVGVVVVVVQRHSGDGFCKGGRGVLFLFILMSCEHQQ